MNTSNNTILSVRMPTRERTARTNVKRKAIAATLLMHVPCFAMADSLWGNDSSAAIGLINYDDPMINIAELTTYIGTLFSVVIMMCNAFAAVLSIISAFTIYVKMNLHEGDITKHIMYLVGGILFLISSTILGPAFFGYNMVN